jgi:hypothetical protein
MKIPTRLLLLISAAAIACPRATRAEEFEAVSSRASADYLREKLPDGSFKPEYYAFAKGGYWSGPVADKSIDKMDFLDVAHVVAGPLANQKYLPSKDPAATKLLIVVYWGTTHAPEKASGTAVYESARQAEANMAQIESEIKEHIVAPAAGQQLKDQAGAELTNAIAAVQAENRMRDMADRNNAAMLGYDSWWEQTFDAQNGTALEHRKQDMLDELEHYRYFVVLMAYDFQMLWKQKKSKLLWETRFSIREQNNAFDQQLEAMTLQASRYFGQDSGGLTHNPLPQGSVQIGEVKSLGAVPEK